MRRHVPKLELGNEANVPFDNHYPVILSVISRHSREFTSCMVAGIAPGLADSGVPGYAGGHQG
ncbi:MAG: hypothetical protein HW390_788 [Candidatus Brocadiaceae bacterium]|nr:hypothetical protein [Candidatus Brocadiaceae bacterium]